MAVDTPEGMSAPFVFLPILHSFRSEVRMGLRNVGSGSSMLQVELGSTDNVPMNLFNKHWQTLTRT